MASMKTISSKTFLSHFCDNVREDKKFCFILGAGASKSSGIKTGAELVQQWLLELQESYSKEELDAWYEQEQIAHDDPAAHYPKIFAKRFALSKKDGSAFLATVMENAEPSCGYSVLVQIMTQHPHNIVITTNFDSLTEDALFIYTQKKPLVVGHASLARFIEPFISRPLIIKIHHDVLLSPKNSPDEIDRMAEEYARQLELIFRYYTPVVVGYGGNDGSLMGFLEKLTQIEGGMFWCYRESDGMPGKRIEALLEKLDGHAVPVKGFDELMIQIGDRLGLERLDKRVLDIAEQRVKRYREQIDTISKADSEDIDTTSALSKMMERGEKDWWYYEMLARNEKDIDKRAALYKEGLQQLPDSPELQGTYALFLKNVKKEYDQADKYFKLALKTDPKNAITLANYALFLDDVKKEYDEAEKYYKLAVEADPKHANTLGNYALFLQNVKKEYDEAKKYYKLAVEADPKHANTLGSYAVFLDDVKKEYGEAEKYYKLAVEADPKHANTLGSYAVFLQNVKKEYDEAEKYYKLAVEADPKHANTLGNYALFLDDVKKECDEAEKYYKLAVEADPKHANTLGNYAKNLIVQEKFDQARKLLKQAFEQNKHEVYAASLELELWFYCFAVFYDEYPESQQHLEELLHKGIRSPGWYLHDVLEVAQRRGHPDDEALCRYEQMITSA